jgi:hypothetical protein
MRSQISISLRTVVGLLFVLGMFFAPLVHSIHYHADKPLSESTAHATCAICSLDQTDTAVVAAAIDLPHVSTDGGELPTGPETSLHTILLSTESSRAPPSSLV